MNHAPVLLVVEPSDALQERLHSWLNEMLTGFQILFAESGALAVHMACAHRPAVCLMEVNLPDGNSLRVIERIRACSPKVQLIAVAFQDNRIYREKTLAAGADHFIPKHDLYSELPRMLQNRPERQESENRSIKPMNQIFPMDINLTSDLPEQIETYMNITTSLLNNMPEGILIEDRTGHIIYANQPILDMTGQRSEELLGRHWLSLIPVSEHQWVAFQSEQRAQNIASEYETRLLTSLGSELPVIVSATPVFQKENLKYTVVVFTDISDRIKTERALRESEERLRTYIERATDYIFTLDQRGRFTSANEAMCTKLGVEEEDLIGTSALNFALPEKRGETAEILKRIWAGEPLDTVELPIQTKDGQVLVVQIRGQIIRKGGRFVESMHIARDVTAQRDVEKQLKETQNFVTSILDHAPASIYVMDLDLNFVLVNRQWEKDTHLSREYAVGKTIYEIFNKELAGKYEEDNLQVLRDGSTLAVEEWAETPNGRRCFYTLKFPLRNSFGIAESVGGISLDITDRILADERAQRHIRFLTALTEIDRSITANFDKAVSMGAIISQAVTLLEVDAATILILDPVTHTLSFGAGQGFRSNRPAWETIRVSESYAGRAVNTRSMVEIKDLENDSSKYFSMGFLKDESFTSYHCIPLIVKGRPIGVFEVFNRSIVERDSEWYDFFNSLGGQAAIALDTGLLWEKVERHAVELEQRVIERTSELNRTNAELERANRTKDEFLANMSHELRTPLNSILGLSESLLEQISGPLNSKQEQYINLISTSGHHLLKLINDILDVSKITAGRLETHPDLIFVREVCDSSLNFVRSQANKKSISITLDDQTDNARIYTDPQRLKQILLNLLNNAVKFTPENGNVTLQITGQPEAERIQFTILDTGIGIASEDFNKLFTPFTQLDSGLARHYEGTGLGLMVVLKLTELLGGSIEVESELHTGSRFTVTLPWKTEDDKLAEEHKVEMESLPTDNEEGSPSIHANRTILLVEDIESNIMVTMDYLESLGYQVALAQNGLEAIQMATHHDPFLILMDIQMPEMNGLQAIEFLRQDERFKSTPIIALTALAMPGDREKAIEAGADEYMTKPFSLKVLGETLERFRKNGE